MARGATDIRILFFGDSLVAGVGDRLGNGWVGRIAAASSMAGLPITPYNLGVRGETSEQIAARWRAEALPRLAAGADSRIVISFGANDTTLENDQPRVEHTRSAAALTTILDEASALALPAFVVGPAPVGDPEQNQRMASVSMALGGVCAQRDTPFVSVLEALLALPLWMEQIAADDGAHPGAEGYDALAELVLAGGWLEWLRS
jgi:acyl-CoA thioesterase I